jgi:hypothetical protein
MKKNYSKPEIVFESFKLSTSIAGDCEEGYKANFGNSGDCVYSDGGVSIFGNDNTNCLFKGDEKDTCYDVPLVGIVIFGS